MVALAALRACDQPALGTVAKTATGHAHVLNVGRDKNKMLRDKVIKYEFAESIKYIEKWHHC